jgi:putative oxidoreductase
MKKQQHIAALLLRLSLAAGFLSAVASRLGAWGQKSSGWKSFVDYTAQVNAFLPASFAPSLAVTSTILETSLGIMLLAGFRIRFAAIGAAALSLCFTIAMTLSNGIKDPLDYSVPAFAAGAFLLSTMPEYKWSIDQYINL